MTTGEAVSKRINELLFEKGWSLYRLCKESCIPMSTLKNLYIKHTKSPSLALVYKIANAFGLTITEFLNSPFFNKDDLIID